MPIRFLLAYLAYRVPLVWLKRMTYPALLVSLGFIIIYMGNLRPTGLETGGNLIWWDALRPFHAAMYLLFALYAWKGHRDIAWKMLFLDACIGLISFLIYHKKTCNLQSDKNYIWDILGHDNK